MNKILIIGLNGAGKSTLAKILGEKLNIEVVHIDKYYFRSNWQAVSKQEWQETIDQILLKKTWIIDGTYMSSFDKRVELADTIIYLNFNKFFCFYRILKRALNRSQPFDKIEGNLNKIDYGLIKKIIKYPKNEILKKVESFKNSKKVLVFKNSKEVKNWLQTV